MKKPTPVTEFGKNLRRIRKDRRMTGPELASKIGVAQPTITGWERGMFEPKFSNLVKLADVFDVSIDEFFGRKQQSADTALIEKSPHSTILQHSTSGGVSQESFERLVATVDEQRKTIANLAAALAKKK